MALQLIYTSAAQLLDSSQSGYGIVARSEVMPREMRRKLTELSRYRTGSCRGITGPQCAYTTLTYANSEYHVLTVTQAAGADYSGRVCHLSHHLVLLPEEVAALLRNKYRPTPAGVILALEHAGFWRKCWEGPPRFLNGEPHLSPQDIPAADIQATWKRLTGHKSNARAFCTPPFEKDCLMTVPEATPVEDILLLWHESDWLSPHFGWGKTFITHADEADNFRVTQRWACTENSPLIRKAMRTGHPVLPIGMDLELGEASDDTLPATSVVYPPGIMQGEEKHQFREHLAARQAARMVPPYQFSEEPDEELYDLSGIRRQKRRRMIATAAVLLLLAIGGGGFGVYYAARHSPARIGEHAAYNSLRSLLSQPYDAKQAAQLLENTEALAKASHQSESDRNRAVVRIVAILQQASESEKHAGNLRLLCELSRQWKLNKNKLCLLYMREATHNRPAAEWARSFSGEELQEWEALIAEEPELRAGLNEPELLAYFDDVMRTPRGESDAHRVADITKSDCQNRFHPITSGEELPNLLTDFLQKAPVTLSNGEIIIARMPWASDKDKTEHIALKPGRTECRIVRSAAQDFYHLRFSKAANKADIDICVRNNRLISISRRGIPVAVSLPTQTGQVLLIPKLAIPLSGIHTQTIPPANEQDFTILPEHLEIVPPSTSHMAASLKLKKGNQFPWVESNRHTVPQRFSFRLPLLVKGGNSVGTPEISAANPAAVEWNGADVSATNRHFETVTCKLTPTGNITRKLLDTFHKTVNTGCAGEVSDSDPVFSLAMVYTTLSIMNKSGLTEEEWDSAAARYCTLFNNKAFSELMQRVAPEAADVLLSYEAASSRSAAGKEERRRVLRLLRRPENRQRIIDGILHFVGGKLLATYREAEQHASGDIGLQLILRQLSCDNDRLNWHFLLQPEEKSASSTSTP